MNEQQRANDFWEGALAIMVHGVNPPMVCAELARVVLNEGESGISEKQLTEAAKLMGIAVQKEAHAQMQAFLKNFLGNESPN